MSFLILSIRCRDRSRFHIVWGIGVEWIGLRKWIIYLYNWVIILFLISGLAWWNWKCMMILIVLDIEDLIRCIRVCIYFSLLMPKYTRDLENEYIDDLEDYGRLRGTRELIIGLLSLWFSVSDTFTWT